MLNTEYAITRWVLHSRRLADPKPGWDFRVDVSGGSEDALVGAAALRRIADQLEAQAGV